MLLPGDGGSLGGGGRSALTPSPGAEWLNSEEPGCVVIADPRSRRVLHISANATELFQCAAEKLLGSDLADWIPELPELIGRPANPPDSPPSPPHELVTVHPDQPGSNGTITVLSRIQVWQEYLLLELEPTNPRTLSFSWLNSFTQVLNRLIEQDTPSDLLHRSLAEYMRLTGFAWGAVVRSCPDEDPVVVAEQRDPGCAWADSFAFRPTLLPDRALLDECESAYCDTHFPNLARLPAPMLSVAGASLPAACPPVFAPATADPDHRNQLLQHGVQSALVTSMGESNGERHFLVAYANTPNHVPLLWRKAALLIAWVADALATSTEKRTRRTQEIVGQLREQLNAVRDDTAPLMSSLRARTDLPLAFQADALLLRLPSRELTIGRTLPEGLGSYIIEAIRIRHDPRVALHSNDLSTFLPEIADLDCRRWVRGFLYLPISAGDGYALLLLRGADGTSSKSLSAPWTEPERLAAEQFVQDLGELFWTEGRRMSNYDSATGLGDRASLLERLTDALNCISRSDDAVVVLVIEFSKFEAYADRFEHDARNSMLVALAGCLSTTLRDAGTVVRLWGSRFACLLEAAGGIEDAAVAAVLCAERLAAASRTVMEEAGGKAGPPGLNVGIALCVKDEVAPEALLQAADAAQSKAKRAGKLYAFSGPLSPDATPNESWLPRDDNR